MRLVWKQNRAEASMWAGPRDLSVTTSRYTVEKGSKHAGGRAHTVVTQQTVRLARAQRLGDSGQAQSVSGNRTPSNSRAPTPEVACVTTNPVPHLPAAVAASGHWHNVRSSLLLSVLTKYHNAKPARVNLLFVGAIKAYKHAKKNGLVLPSLPRKEPEDPRIMRGMQRELFDLAQTCDETKVLVTYKDTDASAGCPDYKAYTQKKLESLFLFGGYLSHDGSARPLQCVLPKFVGDFKGDVIQYLTEKDAASIQMGLRPIYLLRHIVWGEPMLKNKPSGRKSRCKSPDPLGAQRPPLGVNESVRSSPPSIFTTGSQLSGNDQLLTILQGLSNESDGTRRSTLLSQALHNARCRSLW